MNRYHQVLKKCLEQFFKEIIIAQCTNTQEYQKQLFVKFVIHQNASSGFPLQASTKSAVANNKIVQFGTIVISKGVFSSFKHNQKQIQLKGILINDKSYDLHIDFADIVTVAVPDCGFCVDLSSCLNDNSIYHDDIFTQKPAKDATNKKTDKITSINFDH